MIIARGEPLIASLVSVRPRGTKRASLNATVWVSSCPSAIRVRIVPPSKKISIESFRILIVHVQGNRNAGFPGVIPFDDASAIEHVLRAHPRVGGPHAGLDLERRGCKVLQIAPDGQALRIVRIAKRHLTMGDALGLAIWPGNLEYGSRHRIGGHWIVGSSHGDLPNRK